MTPTQTVVLEFARALAAGDFTAAFALCARAYQARFSVQQLQASFSAIIPDDWGPVTIAVLDEMLTDWPHRQPDDVGWVYASIEGEEYPYSEGLYVMVTREGEALRVGDVTFGRP